MQVYNDRKQINGCLMRGSGGEGLGKKHYKGAWGNLGAKDLFIILVVVMVSWIYANVRFKVYNLSMCILYVGYVSIKVYKKT